jgi:hypothetical protein
MFWGAIVFIVFFSSYFRYRARVSRHRMIESWRRREWLLPRSSSTASRAEKTRGFDLKGVRHVFPT